MLAAAGPNGDRTAFTEYIQKNMALKRFRSGMALSNNATASYIRKEVRP